MKTEPTKNMNKIADEDLKSINKYLVEFDRYLQEVEIPTYSKVALYEHWLDCMYGIQDIITKERIESNKDEVAMDIPYNIHISLCNDEFECLKEDIESNTFMGKSYLSDDEYEDDFSHDYIAKNRQAFIKLANNYFMDNNLPYRMRELHGDSYVCDKEGNILRIPLETDREQ